MSFQENVEGPLLTDDFTLRQSQAEMVLNFRRHDSSALSEMVVDVVKPRAALPLVPGVDHFLFLARGTRMIHCLLPVDHSNCREGILMWSSVAEVSLLCRYTIS